MRNTTALVAMSADKPLVAQTIQRRDLRAHDVAIDVTFCGVCHSDLHEIHRSGNKPLVAGHEFVGTVTVIGPDVTRFKVGDSVAVGNIVDSCGTCTMCAVHEDFVYLLPDNLDPAGVAPLMCAGITVWEPLVRWNTGPNTTVAIVGLGGLGHLAVKFAHALGAHVVLFTTSPDKVAGAKQLGADEVVISKDPVAMQAQANRFDLIIDTASAPHDLTPYIRTLALDGTLCSVGALGSMQFDPMTLLAGRKSIASAGSGGSTGTQAMLDFCNDHGLTADVEVLPAREINTALQRLERNDVRFRFALDMHQM